MSAACRICPPGTDADAHELARTTVTGLGDVPSDEYLMSGMAVVAPVARQ